MRSGTDGESKRKDGFLVGWLVGWLAGWLAVNVASCISSSFSRVSRGRIGIVKSVRTTSRKF